MPSSTHSPAPPTSARMLAACGAVLAAGAVALSAYAAHATDGAARAGLESAALFAFGHGIAVAAIAPHARRRLALIALAGLLLGTLLFSGAIVLSRLAGLSLGSAPFGGALMMVAWLAFAIDALRR